MNCIIHCVLYYFLRLVGILDNYFDTVELNLVPLIPIYVFKVSTISDFSSIE